MKKIILITLVLLTATACGNVSLWGTDGWEKDGTAREWEKDKEREWQKKKEREWEKAQAERAKAKTQPTSDAATPAELPKK